MLGFSPVCEWKLKYGTECFFCGMTRAFIEISEFSFTKALQLNFLSVPLFFMLSINEFFAVSLLKKFMKNINQ